MGKRIVLFNDLPGYGKVALAAMVPLFSRMGHFPYQVPTAVVSNTLDFGKFRIQDMTDYMRDTIKVWDELGFDPDCICTGFVLSEEQVELIGDYIRSRKPRMDEIQNVDNGRLVMVDPIMADGGKLYNGIGMERVAAMRKLVSYSDVMVPNMTEAGFLTGICPGRERASAAELRELVDGLHKLSGKSVVITSAQDSETDEHLVCGYDHKSGQYFRVPFTFLPVRVAGSGDIFSTVMTGKLLNGESLEAAVQEAVRVLTALIRGNQSHLDEYKGILVERYWELLDENN
ncbi:PfkB family carbohydrate kinase [Clostridium sp. AM42-4]|uniref:PfkB family carbohydrate kinase n=1 Tax=Clostridium sp. AM42-4 TaxID=2292305 RepID=UPI000E486A84|nr:PfkB family carbohydrate kinase [Clostridium sp. AM42-4]RHS90230.1 phosphomethylpyrimidine kinase [Clostridium sp. AM42-4]